MRLPYDTRNFLVVVLQHGEMAEALDTGGKGDQRYAMGIEASSRLTMDQHRARKMSWVT
jgi:hypothetical protein